MIMKMMKNLNHLLMKKYLRIHKELSEEVQVAHAHNHQKKEQAEVIKQ